MSSALKFLKPENANPIKLGLANLNDQHPFPTFKKVRTPCIDFQSSFKQINSKIIH